jgi:tRNA(Ile)-lysidine synthase
MLKQPSGTLICDAAALPFPLTLRGWLPGDWMRPFGMGGKAKKISDLFSDSKYSLTEKEVAIVVYSTALDRDGDGHVAAVAGLRMDEALRVAKGSVKILRITLP